MVLGKGGDSGPRGWPILSQVLLREASSDCFGRHASFKQTHASRTWNSNCMLISPQAMLANMHDHPYFSRCVDCVPVHPLQGFADLASTDLSTDRGVGDGTAVLDVELIQGGLLQIRVAGKASQRQLHAWQAPQRGCALLHGRERPCKRRQKLHAPPRCHVDRCKTPNVPWPPDRAAWDLLCAPAACVAVRRLLLSVTSLHASVYPI
jgi:hypothetical protein